MALKILQAQGHTAKRWNRIWTQVSNSWTSALNHAQSHLPIPGDLALTAVTPLVFLSQGMVSCVLAPGVMCVGPRACAHKHTNIHHTRTVFSAPLPSPILPVHVSKYLLSQCEQVCWYGKSPWIIKECGARTQGTLVLAQVWTVWPPM